MKTHSLILNSTSYLILLFSALLLSSCGTYLSVYDNDGIYNSKEYAENKENSPVKVVVNQDEYDDYEDNYFSRKLESLQRIESYDIFTDIDGYASESEFNDLNYNQNEPWGFEDNDVVVSLNLWNDPFWGNGFNNWGWGFNNWGFANPWFYGNFNPYWRSPFWGNRFWRGRFWGFNNWNWGFNNPWIWQGGFVNPYWGNRFLNNNFYQNNRWARSTPYRLNRNIRSLNTRYSNGFNRRNSSSYNRRFSNSTNSRRNSTINNRRSSTIRRGINPTRRNSTMRRSGSSSRSRATKRSSSSNRRGSVNRSSSSRSRGSSVRSSSRSSSRSSGTRSRSRGRN